MGLNYKDAGVDVEAGYKSVELMKEHVKSTFRPEVLTDIGGFGGLFSLAQSKIKNPVLVSGTDGVGTKLKLAFLSGKHDTIGIDCVAMCVNDIVCNGAEPLFFLDYIATSKNVPEKIAEIVKGVSEGCKMSGCALIGGETAEMPGLYSEGEYDIAGFAVGIVDRDEIINGKTIEENDALIGIASSGVHSNGFSLIRKVFEDELNNGDTDIINELLIPTKIYVKTILQLKEAVNIKGISNITGGGFIENIPRMIPQGLGVLIDQKWDIPPIFTKMQQKGNIEQNQMFNTFNMGIGMVLAVAKNDVSLTLKTLSDLGEKAYKIGSVTGSEGIKICLS